MKKVAGLALVALAVLMMMSAAWAQCGCNTVFREEAKRISIAAIVIWSAATQHFFCSQEGTVLQLTYQGFLVNILITIDGEVKVIKSSEFPDSVIEHKVHKIRNHIQQIIDRGDK